MMVEWTIGAAAREMTGEILRGDPSRVWRGATIDSRRIEGGELFFALKGEHTDGHRFVDQAIRGGASGVVVEHVEAGELLSPDEEQRTDAAWIRVSDSLAGLHALTRAVRHRLRGSLIGVTGSVGKTTTKEILATILASKLKVVKSPGNLNNLFGFPLALLGVEEDFDWMVAEMGMSTPGELGGVARMGRPAVALMLNVHPAHLANFDTMRAVAEAKAELLEGLVEGGTIVANGDDPEITRVVERHAKSHDCKVVTFGFSPSVDVVAEDIEAVEDSIGYRFSTRWRLRDEAVRIQLPIHGRYNIANFLAAAACARELGVELAEIAAAVGAVETPAMRGRLHRLESGALVVDDTYNSNPAAVDGALASARALAGRRYVAILGDMLELGPREREYHRTLGARTVELGFDEVIGVGPLAKDIVDAVAERVTRSSWFGTADEAASWAGEAKLQAGDVVLVKGSRGVGLEVVVAALLGEERG